MAGAGREGEQLPWGNLEYSIQESEAECVAHGGENRGGGGQCHLPQAKGKAGVLVGLECEFSACKINVDWRDRLGPDLGMPEIADSCFCI